MNILDKIREKWTEKCENIRVTRTEKKEYEEYLKKYQAVNYYQMRMKFKKALWYRGVKVIIE